MLKAKTMLAKLKTFARLAGSPCRYPFMLRLIRSKLTGAELSLDKTRDEATDWCQRFAVDTKTAVNGLSMEFFDPVEQYPQVFSESHLVVMQCSQAMGGGGNLPLLYSLARGAKARNVIETGVAYGWSSLALLLALSEQPGKSWLMSTNLHYPRYRDDDRFVGCAVPADLRGNWKLFPVADRDGIPMILNEMPTADLVHYDSDKRYDGRLFCYPQLWNALRVGGLFVSDDIDDNVGFKHFSKMVRCRPIIVRTEQPSGRTKYVGILRKPDTRKPKFVTF